MDSGWMIADRDRAGLAAGTAATVLRIDGRSWASQTEGMGSPQACIQVVAWTRAGTATMITYGSDVAGATERGRWQGRDRGVQCDSSAITE